MGVIVGVMVVVINWCHGGINDDMIVMIIIVQIFRLIYLNETETK